MEFYWEFKEWQGYEIIYLVLPSYRINETYIIKKCEENWIFKNIYIKNEPKLGSKLTK